MAAESPSKASSSLWMQLIRQRRRTRRRRGKLQQCFILLMLLLALVWFAITLTILWHSLQKRSPAEEISPHKVEAESRNRTAQQQQLDPNEHISHPSSSTTPLVIFTYSRANYLKETLQDILNYIPSNCEFACPVVVSQDGTHEDVAKVIEDFVPQFQSQRNVQLIHWQHPQADSQPKRLRGVSPAAGYEALAKHYGWALTRIFQGDVDSAIVLEEDLHVAPDFFDYFRAYRASLIQDPNLLAISAFNDNGFSSKVKDPTRVLKSDFFPGLGWMLTKRLWTRELQAKWPKSYWDDWLREPAQRLGRVTLRPEISRTFHFGTEGGTSGNQFGNLLSSVHLNDQLVDWNAVDVTRQLDEYDIDYWNLLQSSTLCQSVKEALEQCQDKSVRLEYSSFSQFQRFARALSLMDDEKAGVPRTAYKGVVETRPHGEHLLFLTPPLNDELKTKFLEEPKL